MDKMDEVLKKIGEAKEKGLTELDLSSNELTELPKELFELTNLMRLDLGENKLTKLPKELCELTNLRVLDLNHNQLAELPKEFFELTSLTWLNLKGNKLTELRKEIGQLTNLMHLIVDDNELTELPEEVWRLNNLSLLYLGGIQLARFPKEIVKLTNITDLALDGNGLTEFPKEIVKLTNLKNLYLFNNQLTELPKEIGQLTNLEGLYLNENQLTELPKEIGQLTNLEGLYLNENQLTELPREVRQLTKLEALNVDGNPLKVPPIEIANKGIKAIRNYFKSLEKTKFQKLYEAKLIIVGQGGVGKTCLCRKLMDSDYKITGKEASTEGIIIKNWNWDWKFAKKKVNFKVNTWDFGGQEIYHSTHQFFLTKRSLYIFVWDARKEEDYASFDYWLNAVSLLGDKSPVFIVLNKADERIKEIDQASYQDKFKNIAGFYKVSCLNGTRIKELSEAIKNTIVQLPHVGTEWPDTWNQIRKVLEEDTRDYIDYHEYVEICKRHGLETDEKANYLSSFLHDLGVILHFQDDYILRNIVILKPEWGTDAVYKVLDTKAIQEDKGRFNFKDLAEIWRDSKYPSHKHNELLQLMMKFELCFKLTDADAYIVPELLSHERPKLDWDDRNNFKFEYHYEFMLSGIMTRFIARNYRLVEKDMFWKNGVILNWQGTRAFIISEPLNRKIKISAYGAYSREILAIIRNEFDHIHQTLNNPKMKEKIPCPCNECKNDNAEEAQYFDLVNLEKCVSRRQGEIQCNKSFEMIPIQQFSWIVAQPESSQVNNIFISYSHKDKIWLEKIKTSLRPYKGVCDITTWDDTMLKPGERWFEKINDELNKAKAAILMVSQDFLASDFIQKHELPPLLEAAKRGGTKIFWVAVRPSTYTVNEISKYQCANNPDKPLSSLTPAKRDKELVDICNRITEVLRLQGQER